MNLLTEFSNFIQSCVHTVFKNKRTIARAEEHAFGVLCGESPHTITSIIGFKGTESQDWSADYKLYSRTKWKTDDLFAPILAEGLKHFKGSYIDIAIDDSVFKKTGKKIETASWQRDPMSPHFHSNLIYGLRFLQVSLTLPTYHLNPTAASRAIPVNFIESPILKKPKKQASKEEWKAYKKKAPDYTISTKFIGVLKEFRQKIDDLGLKDKFLISSQDGGFCNKRCFEQDIDRTVRVTRCRKDIKLCHRSSKKKRFYANKKFTPEEVYYNKKIPWLRAKIFRASKYRMIEYKEVKQCYWQTTTKRKEYTLIVLKRIPYHPRKGHTSFRDPAFLLCDQSTLSSKVLIQVYHDHASIEANFKDEKLIGVCEAQVKNPKSVVKQPCFAVATYSSLLLASINVYHEKVIPPIDVLPLWRNNVKRPSIRMLLKQLKKELLSTPDLIHELHLSAEAIEMLLKIAA